MLKVISQSSFLLLLLLISSLVEGQSVINVPAGGSIQNAINRAKDGDTVRVAAGRFQESLFIGSNIVLQGAGVGKTFIEPGSTSLTWLYYQERRTILIALAKPILEGFTITQSSADVDSNHSTIGILLEFTNGTTIRSCKIENHITAIYVSGSTKNVITDNTFSNCGNGLLLAAFASGTSTDENVIVNNEFTQNGVADETDDAGIKVIPNYTGNDNIISGNDIYDNTIGINNQSSTTINAEQNWWGSPSGPRHTTNTGGMGDPVLGSVIFDPFATSPTSITVNNITGTVYYDENENKLQDASEYGLGNQKVLLLPDSIVAFTDINGNYSFNVLDGDYTVQVFPEGYWELSSDSDTIQLTFPGSAAGGNDFGYRTNNITGTIYYDENENKLQDASEYGLGNQKVLLLPDSIVTVTDINGNYSFNVLDGDYTVQVFPEGYWELSSDSDTIQLTFPGSVAGGNDFGYKTSSSAFGITSSLSSAATRCGFTVPFWLSYQNTGVGRADGRVKFLPDATTTFSSASITPTVIDNDTLIWDFSDLRPNERRYIKLYYTMPGVSALGDTVRFIHLAEVIRAGNVVASSIDTLVSEIRCAYDPNDKTATPFGILDQNYTLKDEPISYRIRFQNTGTDTAFNIIVRDTLQADFDLNSFEVISNSHPMRTEINTQERAIAFYFDNILLPDSIVDEPNSHGFINYRIKPKSGLADGTVVQNKAYIYFDFNPPIITNTTLNTLVDELPSTVVASTSFEDISNLVSVFPNPSNGDEVFVRMSNRVQENYQVVITDITGKLVYQGTIAKRESLQDFRIDTSAMNGGIYILQIIQGKKRALKKLIKQ